jgi:ferric-dicitrate binding protein FerR (iron transport regulator)
MILAVMAIAYWLNTRQSAVEIVTGYGETRKVSLPDGSLVSLNANSTIRFSKAWEKDKVREVWIQGEAFFSVVKKQGAASLVKFVVHTRDLDVEVLGTRFNVAERRQQTQVVLEAGKVRLKLNKAEAAGKLPPVLYMDPGQLVEYSTAGRRLAKKTIKPTLYTSWKDGKLIFEDTPLAQVAAIIEQTYGLKVVVEDKSLYRETITGTLRSDNVDLLLESLSLSISVGIERKHQKVIFKKNNE